uniref:Uncharacterized protein n=1 Tax=Ditylenchus dipsaci TaxID=166011 RepID=A0A915EWG0_9BILA
MAESKTINSIFEAPSMKFFDYSKRLVSFSGKWRYDKQKGAMCTSKNLAKAGFVCTATKNEPDGAKCYVCQHEMIWDPEDVPAVEHKKHRPDCELAKLDKPEEEYTIRDWLRLNAYVVSTQQYDAIADSVANLSAIMEKFVINTEKVMQG